MPRPVADAPARYAAFLAALRRTANAALACAQSGVNRSWAYWRRRHDAAFAARWAEALAAGRAATGRGRPPHPDDGRDVPLIRVGGRDGRAAIVRRASWQNFTAPRRAMFLAALRATCNVTHAARAVEIVPSTARRHRRADAAFAAAWDTAMAEGQQAMELALVGIGPAHDHAPVPGIDTRAALHVYHQLMAHADHPAGTRRRRDEALG